MPQATLTAPRILQTGNFTVNVDIEEKIKRLQRTNVSLGSAITSIDYTIEGKDEAWLLKFRLAANIKGSLQIDLAGTVMEVGSETSDPLTADHPVTVTYEIPLINYEYYDAIRALLAPDVTAKHISDAYLSQAGFAPEADRKVRKRLTAENIDVNTLTGENLEDARLAMMHECAAVLCLTAPQQLRQTLIQVVTEVQNIDWKEKRAFHLAEADELINDIVAATLTPGSSSTSGRKRRNPFGAVGTERPDVEKPEYPYR